MRKVISAIVFILISIVTARAGITYPQLKVDFLNPPSSVQTAVYWYWIDGNISKDGVIKDLEAMKSAGINRAFIANIGGDGTGDPNGQFRVEFMSDEWWDITHAALKRASELDIEIGMFNSPGWSQSGGPWISEDQTMRYLAFSDTVVEGPRRIVAKMKQPTEYFEDVKVLAFPNPRPEGTILNKNNCSITISPQSGNINYITDGDINTGILFAGEGSATIDFNLEKDFTARSINIRTMPSSIHTDVELQAKSHDGTYTTISEFLISRVRAWNKVGFDPYADISITIPSTTSDSFRLIFKQTNSESGLAEVSISSTPGVERYKEKSLAKLFQTEVPSWDEYLWREQPEINDNDLLVKTDQVLDISDKLSIDGVLNWDAPEGEWLVLRMGMAPTGVYNEPASADATGYEVDKISKEHVETHFDAYIGEILRRIPANDRKTFKVVVQDSYEVGGQNFTDDLIPIFSERYGYDPTPYLPVLKGIVVESQRNSDAFLWDLRRLIADRISYEYAGGMREISHKHGLTTWLENYGHWGFTGEFLQYGGQADEVGGESWVLPPYGEIENRLATSSAHIYGKKLVSSETSTSAGPAYLHTPSFLKQRMDRFFTFGVNNTVLHLYIQQPSEDRLPGSNAWFGTEFDRNNIWFKHMDLYTTYIKRCNYMMRQGWYNAEVAYFIGEDAPRMVGVQEPAIPVGYQFEYINAEVIIRDLTFKDGKLRLPHGVSFNVLVLPRLKTMRPELLSKIEELVAAGAVIVGPAPEYSPSLENQPESDKIVQSLAKRIWGDIDGEKVTKNSYGKGLVFQGVDLETVLNDIGCIVDCKTPAGTPIYHGHRIDGDTDIYMISNQGESIIESDFEFRVEGKQPELWIPMTGEIRKLPAFIQKEKTTVVPIKLDKAESVFIVFKDKGTPTASSIEFNYPTLLNSIDINSAWNITFESKYHNPSPIKMNVLQDLSTMKNDSIKYFSGTATYTTQVNIESLSQGESLMLNLNKVGSMAKISINGHYVGGVWATPYILNITDFVKTGSNDIKVEVVNTWVNRIVGDLNLPEEERNTYLHINHHNLDTPLPVSGLVGPVRLENVKYE